MGEVTRLCTHASAAPVLALLGASRQHHEQVQEKLVAAAGVAEAATAEAAAALAQARVAGAAAQEADGHLQQLAAELIEARQVRAGPWTLFCNNCLILLMCRLLSLCWCSGCWLLGLSWNSSHTHAPDLPLPRPPPTLQVALSAAPAAVSTTAAVSSHHDAQLVSQLQAQLQAAAADRAGLAAQAEAVAAAHADQAQQVSVTARLHACSLAAGVQQPWMATQLHLQ